MKNPAFYVRLFFLRRNFFLTSPFTEDYYASETIRRKQRQPFSSFRLCLRRFRKEKQRHISAAAGTPRRKRLLGRLRFLSLYLQRHKLIRRTINSFFFAGNDFDRRTSGFDVYAFKKQADRNLQHLADHPQTTAGHAIIAVFVFLYLLKGCSYRAGQFDLAYMPKLAEIADPAADKNVYRFRLVVGRGGTLVFNWFSHSLFLKFFTKNLTTFPFSFANKTKTTRRWSER